MSSVSLELKPDRLLLNSSFDGYKLSLDEITIWRKNFDLAVNRTHLNSSQYSLLHAKLFGLHNHLIVDFFDDCHRCGYDQHEVINNCGSRAVYFVDKKFNVLKTYVDEYDRDDHVIKDLVAPKKVWTIPKPREQKSGDYNVTLKFVDAQLAVLSDGMGTMYILDTRDKRYDEPFKQLFSGKVLNNEEQGFLIFDAIFCEESKELHVLLIHIQEDLIHRFVTIIHWLSFKGSESSQNKEKVWGQTALRQLKTKGEVQYLCLEPNCQHIYVVSDSDIEFVLNSEYPVQNNNSESLEKPLKVYKWSQNLEEVNIKFFLPEDSEKSLVKISTEATNIEVLYNKEMLLSGEFSGKIDSNLTTWTLENNVLDLCLTKSIETGFWPELVKGDQRGEYILDTCIVEQVANSPRQFSSENQSALQSGTTFNSQQVEECDFETDKSETFERISGITNKTTHKIHLGSHQVILSQYLSPRLPPALGIRHDVDVCLWQPILEGENFNIKHEGTLLAFGYVQASKQNRKFTVCAPDLSYSVISESAGHVFIYKQNIPLLSSELRHRASGRRVTNVAQQQVVSMLNHEILGIHAGEKYLYLLSENLIMALAVGKVDSQVAHNSH